MAGEQYSQLRFDFARLDPSADHVFRHGRFSAPAPAHGEEIRNRALSPHPFTMLVPDHRLTRFGATPTRTNLANAHLAGAKLGSALPRQMGRLTMRGAR
jgi:hypothetical protein